MGVASTIGAAGGVGTRAAAIDTGPAETRARLAIPYGGALYRSCGFSTDRGDAIDSSGR